MNHRYNPVPAFAGNAFIYCLILMLGWLPCQAQNLVPNSGFESFTSCPIGFSEFNGYVSDWVDPSIASPDYMNACANPFPAGVPKNGVGYQQAHGGNAYAGCYLTGGGLYTEYIQVHLASPLIAGNEYEFKMYVVLHNNSNTATDDIGAYFSVTPPASTGTGYLSGNPVAQITNPFGNVITDTLNWQLISGTYTAVGGEEYLTLGHFKPDAQTTFVSLPYGGQGCYYYFDDVSVDPMQSVAFDASDTGVCEKFCIDFTDQSTNSPSSWLWLFPGGSPSSSTLQNPIQICYQTPGSYDVTLITTNANGSDTLTLPQYVTVHATPPIPTITQNGLVLTSSPAFSYQWQYNTLDIPGATNQSYTVTQSGVYTVVVADSNGCNSSVNMDVIISGVEELWNEKNISVYPNPNAGVFTVEVLNAAAFVEGGGDHTVSVWIENELGQKVFSDEKKISSSTFKEEIDIREVPPGIYYIRLRVHGEMVTGKILKDGF